MNRSKQIPENNEDEDQYRYLLPMKNGFRSALIIPIIKISGERQYNIFDMHRHELFRNDLNETASNIQKRLSSSNKQTTENFYQRRSANNKRIRSTDLNKQTRTAILMKNNNYLEKIKKPLSHTTKEISLGNTAENFFKQKKVSSTISSNQYSKNINDENVNSTVRRQSLDKAKPAETRPKSAKSSQSMPDKTMHLSPVIQKYLANKLINNKYTNSDLPAKNSMKFTDSTDFNNILQPNNNKLNINFTNVGNLNFVINSYNAGPSNQNASPKQMNSKQKMNSGSSVSKQNLKKIFSDRSTLDEILNKFKSKI